MTKGVPALPFFYAEDGMLKFAVPKATESLEKKLYKLIKKVTKEKKLRRGIKDVNKALRKGEKGLCVIAGDVNPPDIVTHLPAYCEDLKIPYIFVPSKEMLGSAGEAKRPTCCILLKDDILEDDKKYHKRLKDTMDATKKLIDVFYPLDFKTFKKTVEETVEETEKKD